MQKKQTLEILSKEELFNDIEFLLGQLILLDYYQDSENIDFIWKKYKLRHPYK